jgi:TRAP-type C4-dicarboxylate transport system permease small subunit
VTRRVFGALCAAMTAIGAVALAVMIAWTVADVTLRAVFNRPIHGTVDLVEAALVLVVFLGLPESFLRREQITVDVLDHAVPRAWLAAMRIAGALAALAFLVLMAMYVVQPMLDTLRFGDKKPDLSIPLFPLVAAIEVSLVASLAAMVFVTLGEIADAATGRKSA